MSIQDLTMLAAIRQEMAEGWSVQWSELALWLVTMPLYVAGWLAGFLVRCLVWGFTALRVGFRAGRG